MEAVLMENIQKEIKRTLNAHFNYNFVSFRSILADKSSITSSRAKGKNVAL